ncbi:MAG: DUF202 domain-containing protein [Nitrospira sp. CR1.3]|nr:DUF202 domain-containing protein [Nitrospira sp. CR1.3]
MSTGPDTQVRDQLARQRTEMANERTLLAYVRTALGFFIVGVPSVWWLDQPYMRVLGIVALTAGVLCVAVGISRFMTIKRMVADDPGLLDRP